MFGDITRFLLDTIFTLFGAALLVRAWTQAVRLSPRNPLSQGIFQLTGWLVHPLRRVIPATGYIDWSSLVAAYLTALVYLVLLVATIGANPLSLLPLGLLSALFTVLKWAFNVLVWVTIIAAILSWVAPHAPMAAVLNTLIDPLLRPIRRVLPPLGGLDLSPLVLLVAAQVAGIALSHLYPWLM